MSRHYVYDEPRGWREARRYWTHERPSRDILALLHTDYPEMRKKDGTPLDMRALYNHATIWGWPKRDTDGRLLSDPVRVVRETRRERRLRKAAALAEAEQCLTRRCPDCFGVYQSDTCPYHAQRAA